MLSVASQIARQQRHVARPEMVRLPPVWLTRTNLWREWASLKTGSERLRGAGPGLSVLMQAPLPGRPKETTVFTKAVVAACFVLATTNAFAAQGKGKIHWMTTLPPAQYDVPYTGELTIWTVQSRSDILQYCSKKKSLKSRPVGRAMRVPMSIKIKNGAVISTCSATRLSKPKDAIQQSFCATSWGTAMVGEEITQAAERSL
jgi:hypothetical protein